MEPVVDAEVIEAESNASKARKTLADSIARARELPIPVLVVSALILVGGSGGAILYSDEIIEWIQGEPDYQLIEFDAEQSRVYAQSLVDLGHPDRDGRLSGAI